MRYIKGEKAILVGIFSKPGLTVTMKMIVLEGDNLVELTSNICVESEHMPGVYMFSTENIKDDSIVTDCNILAEMTNTADETMKRYGKISFGGGFNNDTVVDLTEIKTLLMTLTSDIEELIAEVS